MSTEQQMAFAFHGLLISLAVIGLCLVAKIVLLIVQFWRERAALKERYG